MSEKIDVKDEAKRQGRGGYRDENLLDTLESRWLTPDGCRFERSQGGFLNLHYRDKVYKRVAVHCCFPFSAKQEYLSIREAEDMGEAAKEIGLIEDSTTWPAEVQALLQEQLQLRYFMPRIKKVKKIKEEFGFSYWEVVTDRGEVSFTIRGGSGSIFSPSKDRYIITDIDGNRFSIENMNEMTAKERKLLDLYV